MICLTAVQGLNERRSFGFVYFKIGIYPPAGRAGLKFDA